MKKLSNEDIQRACDESLIQAATANNLNDIQVLLEAGANPFWNKCEAINRSINALNLQAVQMMVKNTDTLYSTTPMECAAYYNEPNILGYLIPMLDESLNLRSVLIVAAKHSKACFDLVLPLCDPRAVMARIEQAIQGRYNPSEAPEMIQALGERCADLDCHDRLAALVEQAQVSQAPTPSLRRRI